MTPFGQPQDMETNSGTSNINIEQEFSFLEGVQGVKKKRCHL